MNIKHDTKWLPTTRWIDTGEPIGRAFYQISDKTSDYLFIALVEAISINVCQSWSSKKESSKIPIYLIILKWITFCGRRESYVFTWFYYDISYGSPTSESGVRLRPLATQSCTQSNAHNFVVYKLYKTFKLIWY